MCSFFVTNNYPKNYYRHCFCTAYLLNKTETSIATVYIRVVLLIRVHKSEYSSGLLTGSDSSFLIFQIFRVKVAYIATDSRIHVI